MSVPKQMGYDDPCRTYSFWTIDSHLFIKQYMDIQKIFHVRLTMGFFS